MLKMRLAWYLTHGECTVIVNYYYYYIVTLYIYTKVSAFVVGCIKVVTP